MKDKGIRCATEGCGQRATWWVTDQRGVTKPRCAKCRDELIALYGHKIDKPLRRIP